ncbi:LysR family transcriptional regulator [Sneathiella sp. CAU 1612]|uniref:LysR family transcriptional regulator n=1 Tax=Sneathiella sedimenti TaxID=2816034 RepID=A0ABS3F7B3_9PROT|nr:LysR substrate-binding domain-containing protein [Sneathiella sedimenti]MBO0334232.1 LysR family transcriptional regulator [Sneathiella sedimenti]
MMNHAQLKAFHAVAETGGFSAAAKILGLTQPAVTLQVQALEQAYNTKLFKRRGRKTEITTSGKLLLRVAKKIFSLEEEAHTLLSSLDSIEAGQLNIAATSSIPALPLLSKFQAKHPKIRLSFLAIPAVRIEKEVLEFRADIAIQHVPPDDNGLFSVKIAEAPLKLAVSKDHPWSKKKSVALNELTDQKIIMSSDLYAARKNQEHWSSQFTIKAQQILTLQSREIGREAVANNLGVAFFTDLEIRWDGRIHGIEIEDTPLTEATYLLCLKEDQQSSLISSFVEMVPASGGK